MKSAARQSRRFHRLRQRRVVPGTWVFAGSHRVAAPATVQRRRFAPVALLTATQRRIDIKLPQGRVGQPHGNGVAVLAQVAGLNIPLTRVSGVFFGRCGSQSVDLSVVHAQLSQSRPQLPGRLALSRGTAFVVADEVLQKRAIWRWIRFLGIQRANRDRINQLLDVQLVARRLEPTFEVVLDSAVVLGRNHSSIVCGHHQGDGC